MKKSKKKLLVTGGAGFIGSNTALYFSKHGWSIHVIDNLSRKGSKNNLLNLKKISILNFTKLIPQIFYKDLNSLKK